MPLFANPSSLLNITVLVNELNFFLLFIIAIITVITVIISIIVTTINANLVIVTIMYSTCMLLCNNYYNLSLQTKLKFMSMPKIS